MIGSTVSHYRITGKLGEGGMGVVYKAEDTKLARTVALKFLSSASLRESDQQRFVQEAQSAARIHHPNICPIFEISEHEGRLFFAMAFVEGKTIRDLVEAGPLAFSTALDLATQIAGGLEAAHRHGVVHRDIKSGNIVVDRAGNACILDFGLALRQDAERITAPGGTVGTPAYMSPEQAQGLAVDHRTDVWSLGVVLFEMLTGTLPFQRDTHFSVLYAIVNQHPPAVTGLRPQLPKEVDAILDRAFAKDPNQRWQSAGEMAAALRRLRENRSDATETLTAVRHIPAAKVPTKAPAKPRRWKLAAAAVVVLLLAAAGTFGIRKFWLAGPALPEQKQIAVLPFQIIGNQNDETVRALADGLVETLTAKLSQVEDFEGKLLVVPASEVRSRHITSAEAARRLYGANLAITGSAQRWGDRIQFNEVLVDTATVRQLGSRSFEFLANRAIDIRDRAVDGAVRMLALKLIPAASTAMEAGETATPDAYAAYLKGIGYLARYDVGGNVDRAIASLRSAVAQDPRYALAYAALGEAFWRKAKQTSGKREAGLALSSVQQALRLDSRLTAAHIKLGEIYSESGQPQLAIAEEKSALQLAPASAQAYRALGAAYSALGQFSDADAAYREAIQRQPADWYGYLLLGIFKVQRGQLGEARTAFETARTLTPDNEVVYSNLASLDMREGRYRDASNLYSKTLKFEPGARTYAVLGIAYYYQRRYEEAAGTLNSSINLGPGVYQTWGNLGTVYRHLPEREENARQCFRKAIELATQTLQVLRGDYRAHANLAEYWAKLGESKKALAEIDQIPESARSPFIDRIVLVYEFAGDRQRAIDTARGIPENSPVINPMKSDPDLEALWRDIAAHPH
jgi:tetratricopeptide (TPR) repeat protein